MSVTRKASDVLPKPMIFGENMDSPRFWGFERFQDEDSCAFS
jgi:hypothetical protein